MLNFEPSQTTAKASGLREQNKQDKRARILRAARELFSKRGFEQTTTREIARRAGVGTGTVFVYFRDKDELLFHVFREELEPVGAQAFESLDSDAPLIDQLMHVFGQLLEHYGRDPTLSRVFLKQLLFRGEGDGDGANPGADIFAFTFDFVRELAALVEGAQARGELSVDFSPMLAASNLFGAYYLWMIAALTPFAPRDGSHTHLLRQTLRLQIDGLRARS